MIKKCAFLALAAMMSAGAMAQKTSVYEMPDIYGLGNEPAIKKNSFGVDLGVGSEFGFTMRYQHNFNKYIAWDAINFKYAYDYGDEYDWARDNYANEVVLTTGVRAFTNTIRNSNVKFYGNFDFGYGWVQMYDDYYWIDYDKREWYDKEGYSSFAIGFGVGAYLTKKLSIGYYLQGFVGECGHMDHTFRIGYDF